MNIQRHAASLFLIAALVFAAAGSADTLSGLDGGKLDFDSLSGDVVVIVWASWSPKCRDIVERINAIEKQTKARVVSVVFQEDAGDVRAFLTNSPKMRAPVYLDEDGSFSKQHHVTALPGLLIYKDGNAAFRGKLPSDPGSLISRTLRGD